MQIHLRSLILLFLYLIFRNVSIAQWFNLRGARIEITDFMIPSPGWIDPLGQLVTGL